MSLLYHKPPVTDHAHTLFAVVGSKVKALVLPPTANGPLSTQGYEVEPGIDTEFFIA